MLIDYRSDTFTIPTPPMVDAMFKAKVGDDVFGEDPTVKELEQMTAAYFGMETALFCPSGTMSNQIAIKTHTQPGDEVICEKLSHVYIYEAGGIAFNSLCQVKAIDGAQGKITGEQVKECINPIDIHKANSCLVSLENTTNRGGGSCYDITEIERIKEVCLQNNLKLHLDGARIWNALVATRQDPFFYGKIFDSISVCLSKGLGAPVGSLLLGGKTYIDRAKRIRKVLGGGMRQAGYLAAAGIYALENNISRLEDDHLHARLIARALSAKPFIGKMLPVDTNIIIFEVLPPFTASKFAGKLAAKNIRCLPVSESQVRFITHLGISKEMVDTTIQVLSEI